MKIRHLLALGLALIASAFLRAQSFAPETLTAISAVGSVTSGTGFFAQVGAFRIVIDRTGNAFSMQSLNPTYLTSQAGSASYAKTGQNTARMMLTDTVLKIAIPYSLTFSSATSATYTVTTGIGNQTGVMILENVTQTTSMAGLSNMSVRTTVPTNGQVIPGIVVDTTTRVLIRVAGPALANFGVTGTLPNPRLTVMSGNNIIGINDDWSSTSANQFIVQTAATRTGAFAFADGSKDAAIVLDLAAGAYTCIVAGDPGTTGEAILEVYRVPQ